MQVFGPGDQIPALTHSVGGGDSFELGSFSVLVLDTAFHTNSCISYLLTRNGTEDTCPVLFSGDALFVGGCGRFFEGTGADMCQSMSNILHHCSEETQVYCGHEYTISNLLFALVYKSCRGLQGVLIKYSTCLHRDIDI